MVDIVALESAPNLTLLGGATQYWRDAVLGAGWEDAVARHARGRTLVLGNVTGDLLGKVIERADETHVLTRGVPDAAAIARDFAAATVWCGDPADLANHAGGFDTVLAVADASTALPLEAETRPWQVVTDDIRGLTGEDATVVMLVENDLGTHRISGLRNPRSVDGDGDWDPTATWDDSRPRSLERVREVFPGTKVYCLWPNPRQVELLADSGIDADLHATLAFNAATGTVAGPDPAWLISSFARGGHLLDVAPAWLVIGGARVETPDVERVRGGSVVAGPDAPINGRSALDVFAELAAAENLPAIRRLIAGWAAATAGVDGRTTTDAGFGLCTAEADGDDWRVTPVADIPETSATDEQWAALGRLVGTVRDRAWRTPWPSTTGWPRMLNHLAIMAGLHTVPTARAEKLIPPAPKAEGYLAADHQQLVARLEQQDYTIHTLRSKLAWVQLQLDQALERDAVRPMAIVRASGNRMSRVGRNGLRSARGLARRIIG